MNMSLHATFKERRERRRHCSHLAPTQDAGLMNNSRQVLQKLQVIIGIIIIRTFFIRESGVCVIWVVLFCLKACSLIFDYVQIVFSPSHFCFSAVLLFRCCILGMIGVGRVDGLRYHQWIFRFRAGPSAAVLSTGPQPPSGALLKVWTLSSAVSFTALHHCKPLCQISNSLQMQCSYYRNFPP